MECFIRDLHSEGSKHQDTGTRDHHSTTTSFKTTLSGDTTYDKAQTGMAGPSWTGGMGQGENRCHGGGPDHHPDELDCSYCRKH